MIKINVPENINSCRQNRKKRVILAKAKDTFWKRGKRKYEYILDPVRTDGTVCDLHSGRCNAGKKRAV